MDIERAIAIAATPIILALWRAIRSWAKVNLSPILPARFTSVTVREPLRLTHDKGHSSEAGER